MFGLIRRKAYEDLALDSECEIQCLAKQNEALWARIKAGEEYRDRLEREIQSTKTANRDRLQEIDGLLRELKERDMRIAQLEHDLGHARLLCGSFEASWSARCEREASA